MDFLKDYILSSANSTTGFSAWVNSDGVVYWVPPGKDHIDVVLQDPVVFGLNSEDTEKYTSKKGDASDGNLDELYLDLYKRGWVRVRNFGQCFFVSCGNIDSAVRAMKHWSEDVLSTKVLAEPTEVTFSDFITKASEVVSLGDLLLFSVSKPGMDRKSIFNAKEMVSGGVWISPGGVILEVPLTHIKSVIENPALFGLSKEQVKSIYKKHGEGLGSEGEARDEIISLLVSSGWVRIRFHPGDFGFHVELRELNSQYKKYLSSWASKVLSKHSDRADFPVRVCEASMGNCESVFKLKELVEEI